MSKDRRNRWASIIDELDVLAAMALPPERAAAVVVRGDEILARGHCVRLPYDASRQQHSSADSTEKQRARAKPLHAEIMALCDFLKLSGTVDIAACELFTNTMPCAQCAQALVVLDVKAVYYLKPFDNNLGELVLDEAEIPCRRFDRDGYS